MTYFMHEGELYRHRTYDDVRRARLPWEDVTCGLCDEWLGSTQTPEGRMGLAITHYKHKHPLNVRPRQAYND